MRVVDKSADEHLGPACPSCGWRRGQHRPKIGDMPACELSADQAPDLPDSNPG